MDRKKSALNVTVSIAFKIVTLIVSLIVKRYLIRCCGNKVNGLNALYLNIIGVLSVAELGVGSAITFCMYKPIVEGDVKQVNALFRLFRKSYLLIASIMLIVGMLLAPNIHIFAKDYTDINVNIYVSFILMMISVTLTYLFSAEISLINAHKNNYITTVILSGGMVIQYVMQIIVLVIWKSFVLYLICRIIAVIVQWVVTQLFICKNYKHLVRGNNKIDAKTRKVLSKSIRAMFMHKVGSVLVNSLDSIIIATFVGVAVLGQYSNYSTIILSLSGILGLVFTSLVSVVGHMYVKESNKISMRYCEAFYMLNFFMGVIFYLGYYAIIDDFVSLFFGAQYVVTTEMKFVITLNGFVQFLRKSVMVFRDATGTFYNDRWKPLFEGAVNLVLSIVLVRLGSVEGVLIATIITNLLICHIIEPYVLYKNAFKCTVVGYYRRNYGFIAVFSLVLVLFDMLSIKDIEPLAGLFANGVLSLLLSVLLCIVVYVLDRSAKSGLRLLLMKGTD